MRGYQEIPGVSIDSIEIGVAAPDCEDDHLLLGSGESLCQSSNVKLSFLSSLPSSWWWWWMSSSLSSVRSLLNKNFACISFGMLIGCIISKSLLQMRLDNFQQKTSSGLLHPSIAQKYYLVNGKSFQDSLPFEDIFPTNDQQQAQELQKLPITSASSSLTTKLYEMNILSPSIVSSSIAAAPLPSSTSSNSPPHLLYHASLSSFGLLYDPSQASNSYISEYALDYFLINSGGFDAQINQAYCGPATVATMLNSLKYARRFRDYDGGGGGGGFINGGWSFDLPVDPKYTPYPYATQQDVLSGECVRNTVVMNDNNGRSNNPEDNGIFQPPYGLNLEQSSKLLACHTTESSSSPSSSNSDEWSISIQHVDPLSLTLSRMRYELKSALIDPYARVMINYDRKGLGQVGGGHFSPLGAYHEKTDSFLIMDVAKYKYPPVWVGAATLYGAMATPDKCGSWDYPYGQERLVDLTSNNNSATTKINNNNYSGDGDAQRNGTAMEENHLFNPITQEDYESALKALNCKERMRGYIILKKKVN